MKYDDRIQCSVDYIDAHLMESLDLEEVAASSGYSLSHFHRVFPAVTGFSLKEFVRNKRLAAAARLLTSTPRRILDIALDCGFESQEVFTRAFSTLYGVTPGIYRRERAGDVDRFDESDAFARLMQERGSREPLPVAVRAGIIERGWMHLVGMEIHTRISENISELTIPHFWQQTFIPRIGEIDNWITHNTTIAYEVSEPGGDDLLHMACVEVSEPCAPVGMTLRSLEPGFYAAFTPERMLDPFEYSALVRYAYGEWFLMSGYEIRAEYTLDLYIHNPRRDGRGTIEQLTVLVPIAPPHRMEHAARGSIYPHNKE
jgi:AraC family transcriptional regulator